MSLTSPLMAKKLLSLFIPVILTLASASSPLAETASPKPLPPGFKMLQYHEVKSNAAAERSTRPIMIEHFEIPLELIDVSMAKRIPKNVASSLIFKKNGKPYLRWIINPEDTKWHKEVESYLKEKGVEAARGRYFTAYQTASRSYFLVDPKTGAVFSAKVSTDKTGGQWTDKKQTWEDAKQVRLAYEYIMDAIKSRGGLGNGVLIDEPAAFGLSKINHGFLIRTYDALLNNPNLRLIPGFSVLHEEFGRELAERNGAKDPAAFWNEHYNKPLARALAELYAISGMQFDSPHSQNFLVELDEKGRPQGRIAMRDFGDAFVTEEAVKAARRGDLAKAWEPSNVTKESLRVSIGLLHGNKSPSWINENIYKGYSRDFYSEFEKEFQRTTGVDISKSSHPIFRSHLYFTKNYSIVSKSGLEYLKWLKNGRPRMGLTCRDAFRKAI